MARSDLWRWSATRVEIDQRSREARLRMEEVERVLRLRALPARSWIRRVLYRGGRLSFGRRTPDRSAKTDATLTAEVRVAASVLALSVKTTIGSMVRGLSAA
jgi:hypothetical protein